MSTALLLWTVHLNLKINDIVLPETLGDDRPVEMCNRKGESIPNGWGVNSKGIETHDPEEVLNGGGLSPLGGVEKSAGYKGYGLAMMVEMFCGILSGAAYGPNVRQWLSNDGKPANLGQCFVALDPSAFAEGFEDRMGDLMNYCRSLDPAEGETEVLVAGDPERRHIKKVESDGGISYHVNVISAMNNLAEKLKVEPLRCQ